MSTHLVGQRVKRLEDPDLLSGRGQFVDDLHLPNMVHAAFLRSPFAHARITAIDVSEAVSMPGVHAVWTPKELPTNMHGRRLLLQVPEPGHPSSVYPRTTGVRRGLLCRRTRRRCCR